MLPHVLEEITHAIRNRATASLTLDRLNAIRLRRIVYVVVTECCFRLRCLSVMLSVDAAA